MSPVSSIPYTMTCVWGLEMGKATILFHIGLVLIQFLLLLMSDYYVFSNPLSPVLIKNSKKTS